MSDIQGIVFDQNINKVERYFEKQNVISFNIVESSNKFISTYSENIDFILINLDTKYYEKVLDYIYKINPKMLIGIYSNTNKCLNISCDECINKYKILRLFEPLTLCSISSLFTLSTSKKCPKPVKNETLSSFLKIKQKISVNPNIWEFNEEKLLISTEIISIFETQIFQILDLLDEYKLKYKTVGDMSIKILNK